LPEDIIKKTNFRQYFKSERAPSEDWGP